MEHASPFQRSVRELNPVFVSTTDACCRSTYRPCFSDHGWNRTIGLLFVTQASSPLDHGTVSSHHTRRAMARLVVEVGVEPTKSPDSRSGRFACLRTRPWLLNRSGIGGGSGSCTRATRLMRPRGAAGSTRKLQAPESNRVTDLMKVSSVPTGLQERG